MRISYLVPAAAAIALLPLALSVGAYDAGNNRLTQAEKSAGWVLLFDGHSFNGWDDPAKLNPPGDAWTIEDECLKTISKPRISEDLFTRDKYRDFEFQFDWRISAGGNSGVKYRVQALPVLSKRTEPPQHTRFEQLVDYALEHKYFDRALLKPANHGALYTVGFEYQVIDNARHPDALRGPLYQSGALYGIVPPAQAEAKPVGEFNHSVLIVRGQHVEHWLNGTKVVDVTITEQLLNHALAKRWGAFSPAYKLLEDQPVKDCPIGLQNHGDTAWFRNLKIHKL